MISILDVRDVLQENAYGSEEVCIIEKRSLDEVIGETSLDGIREKTSENLHLDVVVFIIVFKVTGIVYFIINEEDNLGSIVILDVFEPC